MNASNLCAVDVFPSNPIVFVWLHIEPTLQFLLGVMVDDHFMYAA